MIGSGDSPQIIIFMLTKNIFRFIIKKSDFGQRGEYE